MNEMWNFYFREYTSEGAISSDLRRHIIHFGPVRFFFRYGLLGIFLIFYIFYITLKTLSSVFSKKTNDLELFFSITLLMYLLRFFIQPIFNDIIILFCLSGLSFYRNLKNVK